MKSTNNIPQLIEELQDLLAKAPYVQGQVVLGNILGRIFNEGEDTSGGNIGYYKGSDSKSKGAYKAKRNAAGLRIDKVDFQFKGDLFRAIDIGKTEDGAAIGFTNKKAGELADILEKNYNKVDKIFVASDTEKKESAELMGDYLKEGIDRIFKE